MFKNYWLVLFRNLTRQRAYAFINIFGLALGLACSIMIMLFVRHEFSYDNFHPDADRLYRTKLSIKMGEREMILSQSMPPLAPAVAEGAPDVEAYVRYQEANDQKLKYEDQIYDIGGNYITDPSFLDVFGFDLLEGSESTALNDPYSIVLSMEMAEKIFGDEDPIGKSLIIDGGDTYNVTGVLKQIPTNTSLEFDVLTSISSVNENTLAQWQQLGWTTYYRLAEGANIADIDTLQMSIFDENFGNLLKSAGQIWTFTFEPLLDIHLKSDDLMHSGISIEYLMGLAAIAAFILILACINFINLSTARSGKRAKEVGMRKVLGAQRRQLVYQFMGESFFFAFIALVISLLLVYLALPAFSDLASTELRFNVFNDSVMMLGLASILIIVGLLSGAFPALVLSSFMPLAVLKGLKGKASKGALLRRILVVGQFVISIGLIIATATVLKQIQYVQSVDLGFDKEQVVAFNIDPGSIDMDLKSLKSEMAKLNGVDIASVAGGIPFDNRLMMMMVASKNEETNESLEYESAIYYVDYEFLPALGVEMSYGRNFSTEFPSDAFKSVIINEKAMSDLGWSEFDETKTLPDFGRGSSDEDEGGLSIKEGAPEVDNSAKVVGVVKDFHFSHLQNEIMALTLIPGVDDPDLQNRYTSLLLRFEVGNHIATMENVEGLWKEILVDQPFEPIFMDDMVNRAYSDELKFAKMISSFAALAIIIASLGLFGLASFTTELRTKEIGVRKVLGASVGGVIVLLSREFTVPVLIASIIAIPAAWYPMHKWLENFAYRITMGPELFIVAALLALIIAWASVFFQAYRAARANPVKALHYE